MEYYILNSDFEVIMGVELFQSMIWTTKFYESGDFELYLPATDETFRIYTEAAKNHYYIIQAKDTSISSMHNLSAMVINNVKLDDTYDKGDFLIIKGKQLKNVLSQRIVWGKKTVAGLAQDVLRDLVIENAISPGEIERVIPNLILGDINPSLVPTPTDPNKPFINMDVSGLNLADAITKICKDQKLGWDIVIDFAAKKMKFVVLSGVDRSRQQTDIPWVTFAVDYDNLIKTSYKIDSDNYKNVALVASTYEEYDKSSKNKKIVDANQVVTPYSLPLKPAGLNRYELYVKGDNPTIDNENDEVNVNLLRSTNNTKGRTELEKYKSKIEISAEVSPNITYKYDEDYKLGDLVTIQNEYGIRYDARVTSVTTTLTTSKNQTIPSFTIENYTGKEEDNEEKDTEDIRRVDENGNYRETQLGSIRTIGKGLKISVLRTETGSDRETEDGYIRDVIVGSYDDSKYNLT